MATSKYKAKVHLKSLQSTVIYPFNFDYINKSFVKVKLNGVDLLYMQDYTVYEHEVTLKNNPPDDVSLVIYRDTPTDRQIDWTDSSVFRAVDLSLSYIQTLHIIEECLDYIQDNALLLNEDGTWNARNKLIHNLGNLVNNVDPKLEELPELYKLFTSRVEEIHNLSLEEAQQKLEQTLADVKAMTDKDNRRLDVIFPRFHDGFTAAADCVLVGIDNKWFMIDTYLNVPNSTQYVKQALQENNITELEFILITHYHEDHVGGLDQILDAVHVKKVYLPDLTYHGNSAYHNWSEKATFFGNQAKQQCEARGVPYENPPQGNVNFYGANLFLYNNKPEDFTHYKEIKNGSYNNLSVCMLISYIGRQVLLEGDAEYQAIRHNIDLYTSNVDLTKSNHHGMSTVPIQHVKRINPEDIVFTITTAQGLNDMKYWGYRRYFQNTRANMYTLGRQLWENIHITYKANGEKLYNKQLVSDYPIGRRDMEIHLDANYEGSVQTGEYNYPFKYLIDAIRFISGNPAEHVTVLVHDGDYTSNRHTDDIYGSSDVLTMQYIIPQVTFKAISNAKDKVFFPTMCVKDSTRIDFEYINWTAPEVAKPTRNYRLEVNNTQSIITNCSFDASFSDYQHNLKKRSRAIYCTYWAQVDLRNVYIKNCQNAIFASVHAFVRVAGVDDSKANPNTVENVAATYTIQDATIVVRNGFNKNTISKELWPISLGGVFFAPTSTPSTTTEMSRGSRIQAKWAQKPFINQYVFTSENRYIEDLVYNVYGSIDQPPQFVGQHAIQGGQAYIAVGTSSKDDWKQITK